MSCEQSTNDKQGLRILCDSQDCAWEEIFGREKRSGRPGRRFTEGQFLALQRVIGIGETANLLRLVSRFNMRKSSRLKDLFLGSEYLFATKIRKVVDCFYQTADFVTPYFPTKDNIEAFWAYWPSKDARLGFARLSEEYQAKISLCTGMPDKLAANFIRRVKTSGFGKFLDSDYPIFMSPSRLPDRLWPNQVGNSAITKLATAYYFWQTEGKRPVSIDDSIEINELTAYLLGMISFNTLTKDQAEKRRMFYFPKELEKYRVAGGQIIHASISEVPRVLREIQLSDVVIKKELVSV